MESFSCQPLFDRLTHVAIKTGALSQFANFRTSFEKLEFCWNTNVIYDGDMNISFRNEIEQILEALYKLGPDHGKSETLALQVKEKGSKAYLRKKDADAHTHFTESLKLAPENSTVLSLAYGNRSAVLFQMARYQEALEDMERAEANGYPSEILHKILARRCSCHIMLINKLKAEETLEQCKKQMSLLSNENKDKFQKTITDLEKKIVDMSPAKKKLKSGKLLEVPSLFKGESASVAYMTNAFEMRVDESFGRHVVSAEQINKGSVVFVEKPYAAILLPEHHKTHCHQCFTRATNPLPCQKCRDAVFCKEECRKRGQDWHQYECGILHILSAVGIAHLALRVILITGWKLYCKISNEGTKGRTPGANDNKTYNGTNCAEGYRAVYHLMPHLNSSFPEDQLQYCLASLLLSSAVLSKTSFSKQMEVDVSSCETSTEDKVILFATAVMRHVAQLVANAHAITQVVPDGCDSNSRVEAVAQKRIASAIYPTASLMNHSCQPTIINSFINDLLVIRTIKNVQQGEQVFNCYGPHYCRQSFQERQEALKRQYFFTCRCDPCTLPQYRLREAAWSGFNCESCGGISSWSVDDDNSSDSTSSSQGLMICLECHKIEKPSESFVQTCTKVSALQETAEDALRTGDLPLAATSLMDAIRVGSKVYFPQNHFYVTLKDTLAKTFGDLGDFDGCCRNLRECIQAVEARYGSESIELGHELLKFADVLTIAAQQDDRMVGELRLIETKIDRIFTLNYGSQWKLYLKLES